MEIAPTLEVDNFAMPMSLVTSKRGMALLPASIEGYLPWSITSRPLAGERPTVDLVVGYRKANYSPILKKFLSRIDNLSTRIYSNVRAE